MSDISSMPSLRKQLLDGDTMSCHMLSTRSGIHELPAKFGVPMRTPGSQVHALHEDGL